MHVPKGVMHGFRNAARAPAKLVDYHTPGGFDRFFAECGVPCTDIAAGPPKGLLDMAFVMRTFEKHGMVMPRRPGREARRLQPIGRRVDANLSLATDEAPMDTDEGMFIAGLVGGDSQWARRAVTGRDDERHAGRKAAGSSAAGTMRAGEIG